VSQETRSTVREPISGAIIKLIIPCLAEYISVARLAVLGIAGRMPFTFDEIEDVRLAVGEACSHAVERARTSAQAEGGASNSWTITLTGIVSDEALEIDVEDNIPVGEATSPAVSDPENTDGSALGALLMEILVDDVDIKSHDHGTKVRLVRRTQTS